MSGKMSGPKRGQMSGPLAGIRVLDLSSVVMGPYATQMLGDLGADVIKVEPPDGDTTRQAGHAKHPGMGAVFLTIGRNKRSVVIDLKRPGARDTLFRLLDGVDVFLHNMRPDAVARLGIDYAAVAAIKPDIVYCTASGFSSAGPYAQRPAYDDMIQGASGTAAIMAAVTGEPAYVPMVYADKVCGLFVANAILAALVHRSRTGQGQQIEVPMLEAVAAFTLVEHLYDATFDPPLGPPGYPRALNRNRRPFRTRDGFVCALPYTDRHFQRFFALVGRPELTSDPRFKDIASRIAHVDALYTLIAELLTTRPTAEWLAAFETADIPAMAVNSLADLLTDPHLRATGFFERHDHPTEGWLKQCAVPMRFAATPGKIARPAPRLGEHTVEVLGEAGFVASEITGLAANGAIVDGQ
jgi:crotonobetainyl-CoA:carnitine CoA-transferase CaiB-like acyl-CoA transferase